jgi:AbrB family looped-hinge helix DNA binding protein
MPQATITSKGQITIPIEVRRQLHLKPGDRVDFVVDRTGGVQLRPKTIPLASLLGMLHRPGQKAVTVEQMHAAVEAQAVEDWERVNSGKG